MHKAGKCKFARRFEAYIVQGVLKKLNKSEIALRVCKALQCTKFFIEVSCLGTNNVVKQKK